MQTWHQVILFGSLAGVATACGMYLVLAFRDWSLRHSAALVSYAAGVLLAVGILLLAPPVRTAPALVRHQHRIGSTSTFSPPPPPGGCGAPGPWLHTGAGSSTAARMAGAKAPALHLINGIFTRSTPINDIVTR